MGQFLQVEEGVGQVSDVVEFLAGLWLAEGCGVLVGFGQGWAVVGLYEQGFGFVLVLAVGFLLKYRLFLLLSL